MCLDLTSCRDKAKYIGLCTSVCLYWASGILGKQKREQDLKKGKGNLLTEFVVIDQISFTPSQMKF